MGQWDMVFVTADGRLVSAVNENRSPLAALAEMRDEYPGSVLVEMAKKPSITVTKDGSSASISGQHGKAGFEVVKTKKPRAKAGVHARVTVGNRYGRVGINKTRGLYLDFGGKARSFTGDEVSEAEVLDRAAARDMAGSHDNEARKRMIKSRQLNNASKHAGEDRDRLQDKARRVAGKSQDSSDASTNHYHGHGSGPTVHLFAGLDLEYPSLDF
jgi:hypothetical protein